MTASKAKSKGVRCPQCAEPSAVVRTRLLANGTVVRRRECLNPHCRQRFSTTERPHAAGTGH